MIQAMRRIKPPPSTIREATIFKGRGKGFLITFQTSRVNNGTISPPPTVPAVNNTPTLPLNRYLTRGPSTRGSVKIRPSSVAILIISALSNRSSVSRLDRPNERSSDRLANPVERPDERNNGPRMCLARAHTGTAVEESNTPVYEATKRPNTLPITSMTSTGQAPEEEVEHNLPRPRGLLYKWHIVVRTGFPNPFFAVHFLSLFHNEKAVVSVKNDAAIKLATNPGTRLFCGSLGFSGRL